MREGVEIFLNGFGSGIWGLLTLFSIVIAGWVSKRRVRCLRRPRIAWHMMLLACTANVVLSIPCQVEWTRFLQFLLFIFLLGGIAARGMGLGKSEDEEDFAEPGTRGGP